MDGGPQDATQALSGLSARLEAILGGVMPQQAMAGATQGADGPAKGATQHITNHINAASASANELFQMLERQKRQAAGGALFDRAPTSGPFGR